VPDRGSGIFNAGADVEEAGFFERFGGSAVEFAPRAACGCGRSGVAGREGVAVAADDGGYSLAIRPSASASASRIAGEVEKDASERRSWLARSGDAFR